MSHPTTDLSTHIGERIANKGFCVVTDHKLREAFPATGDLEAQAARIQAFAEENNLDVNISFLGICATFIPKGKKPRSSSRANSKAVRSTN